MSRNDKMQTPSKNNNADDPPLDSLDSGRRPNFTIALDPLSNEMADKKAADQEEGELVIKSTQHTSTDTSTSSNHSSLRNENLTKKEGPGPSSAPNSELGESSPSLRNETDPKDVNQRRLMQSIFDAGQYSNGIVAIDVWVMNNKKSELIRPDGLWWRDPDYVPPFTMDKEACMKALQKLEDLNAEGYVEPEILQPGYGIAGKLWVENKSITSTTVRKHAGFLDRSGHSVLGGSTHGKKRPVISSFGSFHGGNALQFSWSSSFKKSQQDAEDEERHRDHTRQTLIWTSLEYMSANPHHIPENRLEYLIDAGFGQVAGVPFHLPGSEGIVLFYAKPDTDETMLNKEANVNFLRSSTTFIAAAWGLSAPTIATMESRRQTKEFKWRQTISFDPTAIVDGETGLDDHLMKDPTDDIEQLKHFDLSDRDEEPESEERSFLAMKLVMFKDKLFDKKVKAKPPPSMSNSECVWAFFGAFLTLLFVSYSAEAIQFWTIPNSKYAIPIGPFGAFTTLLYTLTAAPPAQPRNAIYGTVIAGCTALCVSYIPSSLMSFRVSLATGMSIALMARFGVTHPPGGALAVILAMGNFHWGSLLLYLVADIITIAIAVLINNLNEKRKYPQYWHFIPQSLKKQQ